jgi:hypothetical protein
MVQAIPTPEPKYSKRTFDHTIVYVDRSFGPDLPEALALGRKWLKSPYGFDSYAVRVIRTPNGGAVFVNGHPGT